MAKTPGEAREYQRGYNRGRSRAITWATTAISIAKGYRARLTDVHPDLRCVTCARWTRGCTACVWGFCRGDFERGAEPAMWADSLPGETSQRQIITTENFGCVNWLPRESADGG